MKTAWEIYVRQAFFVMSEFEADESVQPPVVAVEQRQLRVFTFERPS